MASYADDLGEDPFPNTGLQGASHDQVDFRSQQFRQPVLQFDELEERRGALELHENVDIAPRALLVPHDGAEDTQGSDAATLLEGGQFCSKRPKYLIERQGPRISFRRGLTHGAIVVKSRSRARASNRIAAR